MWLRGDSSRNVIYLHNLEYFILVRDVKTIYFMQCYNETI
jgi:hypothetical protein